MFLYQQLKKDLPLSYLKIFLDDFSQYRNNFIFFFFKYYLAMVASLAPLLTCNPFCIDCVANSCPVCFSIKLQVLPLLYAYRRPVYK
jgi:hypothetical protein